MKLYKFYQIFLIVLYAAMIAFFCYQCLKDGTSSSQASDNVAKTIAEVQTTITQKPVVVDDSYKISIRKLVGHFGYFMLMGGVSILLWLSIKNIKPKPIILIPHYILGCGFALFSEFVLEKNTSGRGASIIDVGIDSLGFVSLSTFVFVIYLIVYLVKRKKKNDIREEI